MVCSYSSVAGSCTMYHFHWAVRSGMVPEAIIFHPRLLIVVLSFCLFHKLKNRWSFSDSGFGRCLGRVIYPYAFGFTNCSIFCIIVGQSFSGKCINTAAAINASYFFFGNVLLSRMLDL